MPLIVILMDYQSYICHALLAKMSPIFRFTLFQPKTYKNVVFPLTYNVFVYGSISLFLQTFSLLF